MDLATFTTFTQVVFAQVFDIDVSMITASSVEVTHASAVLIAFSAAGSGCRGLSASVMLELCSAIQRRLRLWLPSHRSSWWSLPKCSLLIPVEPTYAVLFQRVQRRSSLLGVDVSR